MHYHFSNGVVVHSGAYADARVGGEGGACFVGTKGRIAVDRSSIVSEPASILTTPLRPEEVHLPAVDGHSGNFLDCIRTRRPTICNPEIAAYTINAILVGGIALALQRNVHWNPAALEFPGDETANRLLS